MVLANAWSELDYDFTSVLSLVLANPGWKWPWKLNFLICPIGILHPDFIIFKLKKWLGTVICSAFFICKLTLSFFRFSLSLGFSFVHNILLRCIYAVLFLESCVQHAGINKQFRVVRDNRVSQNAKNDIKQGTLDQSTSSISQTMSNAPEKRFVFLTFWYYFSSISSILSTIALPSSMLWPSPSFCLDLLKVWTFEEYYFSWVDVWGIATY